MSSVERGSSRVLVSSRRVDVGNESGYSWARARKELGTSSWEPAIVVAYVVVVLAPPVVVAIDVVVVVAVVFSIVVSVPPLRRAAVSQRCVVAAAARVGDSIVRTPPPVCPALPT